MRAFVLLMSVFASPVSAEDVVVVFSTSNESLELGPDDFEGAHPTFANNTPGISFVLEETAAEAFADLTERSIGQRMSMSVCGEVLIDAVVQARLEGHGNAQVEGLGLANLYARRMTGEVPCP